MRNYKSIIYPVTAIALVFCLFAFNGCEKSAVVEALCKTCKATYSSGLPAEEQTVCTAPDEQAFRDHWNYPGVTVNCSR